MSVATFFAFIFARSAGGRCATAVFRRWRATFSALLFALIYGGSDDIKIFTYTTARFTPAFIIFAFLVLCAIIIMLDNNFSIEDAL